MKRGFTLIELLLGLVIFSIISVTVYSVFWGGINISRRSESQSKFFRDIRLSLELMAKEIENARPYDFINSYPGKTAFVGERNQVAFISATEDGLKVVRYYLVPPEDASVHRVIIGEKYKGNRKITAAFNEQGGRINYLVREEIDFIDYINDKGAESSGENIEVLIPNVKENGLTFSFGSIAVKDSSTISWEDEWTSAPIPRMVKVKLELVSDDENQNSLALEKDILIPHAPINGEDEKGDQGAETP